MTNEETSPEKAAARQSCITVGETSASPVAPYDDNLSNSVKAHEFEAKAEALMKI